MSILIVGAENGNIGAVVKEEILTGKHQGFDFHIVHSPSIQEMDVKDNDSVNRYIDAYGPFEMIVYSAGVNQLAYVKNMSKQLFDFHMHVNVYGLINVMAAHEERYPEHSGRLAVVVSDASDTPMRGSVAYCASKAAQAMTVRVLARELGPRWVTVSVSPGVVEGTPMTESIDQQVPKLRGWTPEQARAYEDKGSILGRRVTKLEVAETILFALTGPVALNGTDITINGGK